MILKSQIRARMGDVTAVVSNSINDLVKSRFRFRFLLLK